MTSHNQYTLPHTPFLRRLGWRILPPTRSEFLPSRPREWAADVIWVTVDVHLGLVDRVRSLFLGRLEVRARVYTEHVPGRTEADSSVSTA